MSDTTKTQLDLELVRLAKRIEELVATTVGLKLTGEKLSQNGAHVSITLTLDAKVAEEIVFLIERSQKLPLQNPDAGEAYPNAILLPSGDQVGLDT